MSTTTIPSSQSDYIKLIDGIDPSTQEKGIWQIIENAINAGSTKDATEAAITEAIQNSLDAIRSRTDGGRDHRQINIDYGLTADGNYYYSVEDYVGIPYSAISALTVPYYSQKDASSVNTSGEMGNGLFNIYREALLVEIDSRAREQDGFIILDQPIRRDGQVVDLKKGFRFKSGRDYGTIIKVVLPKNDRYKLIFSNLRQYLTRFQAILDVEIRINGKISNDNFYKKGSDGKPITIYDPDSTLTVRFTRDDEVRSYIHTKGVPFMPLDQFVETEFFQYKNIIPHLYSGIVIDILKDYNPVQSRTSITLGRLLSKNLEIAIGEATFLSNIFRKKGSELLENYSSESDPKQLKFNVEANPYDGRLTSFINYYQSKWSLENHSFAKIINYEITRRTTKVYKWNEITDLINGWFRSKKTDPKFEMILVRTESDRQTESRSDQSDQNDRVLMISSILRSLFEFYVKEYCRAAEQLKINLEPPRINIFVSTDKSPCFAFYQLSDKTINCMLGQKYSLKADLDDWANMLLAISNGKHEQNPKFKRYFHYMANGSCVLDHELLHALTSTSHTESTHGVQSIKIKGVEVKDDFEKVAIRLRQEMNAQHFSSNLYRGFREIGGQPSPTLGECYLKDRFPSKVIQETGLGKHGEFECDIIYKGVSGYLVKLSSRESAIYWGRGTQWSTAAQNNNTFDYYNSNGPLYVIVDRVLSGTRYQLHPASRQFMNHQDRPVKLAQLAEDYPDLVSERTIQSGPSWDRSLIREHAFFLANDIDKLSGRYTLPTHYTNDEYRVTIQKWTMPTALAPTSWGKQLYGITDPLTDLTDVQYLTFGQSFNQPVRGLDLKHVTHLTFGESFNQPVEGLDLKHVTHLRFGDNFNQPIEGLDLKHVTELIFPTASQSLWGFNQPVRDLNLKNVTKLEFGDSFNQPVEGLDLKNVTELVFGESFNQPVKGLDLKNVQSLIVMSNLPLNDLDLKNVTKLEFGYSVDQPFEGLDLKNVQSLTFNEIDQPFEDLDLKNVQNLIFNGNIVEEPLETLDLKNVASLEFGYDFTGPIRGLDLKNVQSLKVESYIKHLSEDLDLKNVRSLTGPTQLIAEFIDNKDIHDIEYIWWDEYE